MEQPLTGAKTTQRFRAMGLRFGNNIVESAIAQGVVPADARLGAIIGWGLLDLASQRPDGDEVEAFANGLKDILMSRHSSLVCPGSEPSGADGLNRRFLHVFEAESEPSAWESGRGDFRTVRASLISHLRCSQGEYAAQQRERIRAVKCAIPTRASARAEMQPQDLYATAQAFLTLVPRDLPSPESFARSCMAYRETTLALAPDHSQSIESGSQGSMPHRSLSQAALVAISRAVVESGIQEPHLSIFANEMAVLAVASQPRARSPRPS